MNAILIVATALGAIGPTLFLSYYLKASWRISLFLAINLIITQLYVFALIGLLRPGLLFIYATGVLMVLFTIWKIKPKLNLQSLFTTITWSLPTLIFMRAVTNDFRFTMSDEFPSWAANIKTLFFENRLGDINSGTRSIAGGFYQSYPPAQELIQYFFIQGFGWSEANVMRAQILVITSALIFIFSLAFKDSNRFGLVGYVSSLILFYLFGFGFSNILADGLLAIYFAATLVLIMNRESLKHGQIFICLLIGLNILIKPTGFVLATILILAALVFQVMNGTDRSNLNERKIPRHQLIKITRIGSQLAVLPLIMYVSWQLHLRRIGITPGAENPSISKILRPEFRLRWEKTWEAYKTNFFGSLYGPDNLAGISTTAPNVVRILHISLFSIVVVLALIQFGFAFLGDAYQRKNNVKIAIIILFSAIAYQIFLLFLYMFFFDEYAGVRAGALVRYSVSFLLGWTIFDLVLVLQWIKRFKFKSYLLLLILIPAMIIAPSNFYSDIVKVKPIPEKLTARLDVEKMVPATLAIIKPNNSVYYIYQQSTGEEKYMFAYLILPNKNNWGCWSIGKSYGTQDVWTCNKSIAELLIGYDYLVVGNGDEKFWDQASPYLVRGSNAGRQGIYKISFPGNKLQLTHVNS
jgi:hypothetical protein